MLHENRNITNDLQGKYLSFLIDNATYAVGLLDVIEIINIQPMTLVPQLPNFVKGIINLRGKIVPVIDMRLKFEKEVISYDEKTSIIVISIQDMQIGLIVDRVSDVVTTDSQHHCQIPDITNTNENQYIKGIIKKENHVILILDCIQLLGIEQIYSNS